MISKKAKLIFLMPPKTASNSLRECLLDSSLKFDNFPNHYKFPKIHLYLSELVDLFEIEDIKEYKIIQVTRDPLIRFVSTYFHQLKILPQNKFISEMNINEFSEHLYKCLIKEGDFLQNFYGDANKIKYIISKGKSFAGSRLYLNQHQWNDMGANITYIKIEELSQNIELLSNEVGVYLPELDKINTNKKDVDYDSIPTKRIKEIVNAIYYSDFKKLNYG